MHRTAIAAMGVVVVAACIGTPKAAADNLVCSTTTSCSFVIASRNISCELDFDRSDGVPDQTYCQSTNPPQSVTMSLFGEIKTCTGISCLGNPGQGTPVLRSGDHAGVGPFSCNVELEAVSCTANVRDGFIINNSAITPLN
jgi:hypothetical protein